MGGPLSFFQGVYDIDTLDTRFTTPSTVPYKTVIDARGDDADLKRPAGTAAANNKADGSRTNPPRWKTPEFYFYYFIFATVVPFMFWIAYDVSRPSDPRYAKYEHLLSPGWIPGRKIDVSDNQYYSFRSNLPYMLLLLVFHPLCRRLWNAVFPLSSWSAPRNGAAKPTTAATDLADARLEQRASYDFAFALLYLVILHGFSAAKVLLILYANFNLATRLPRKQVPVATWVANICLLFANELCKGYKFRDLAILVGGRPPPVQDLVSGPGALIELGAWLDRHGGLMPRWEILFNITVLRLISFNLDYVWSFDRRNASPIEADPANLSERDRVTTPAAPGDYSFRNYLAYAVYAPLYLTGPILTFNDYVAQQRYRPATIETARTVRYGVRFALVLLAMEAVLHFDYVGAIAKAAPDWSSYTPAQLSLLSYFNLHVIWLKLLLPWRFFRLWALADGVDPPENMLRCVSNNFSALSFWRAWHRSYYRWLLRYIYIPLGGSDWRSARAAARSLLTYLLVFTFVALWHDIQMRLLLWGWLVVLFMVPEVAAGYLFPRRAWASRPFAYRMLCCAGAVGNVLLMMAANLVGFAVGLDGLWSILGGIFRDFGGFLFLVTACGALFVGIQVMFEIRESEFRKGIFLKC